MLNIYFGRESLDKEKFIFDNLTDKTIILVPDQYTLEAERQAFRHLGVSALMDVEILSPSRLGSRLLSQMGGDRRRFIDKYGRHMLLYKSALKLQNRLQIFKGMERKASFLDSVNNFISEMKQYDCTSEDLMSMADQCEEGSYTQRKLLDIYALFSDYEQQISGKYTDSEDYINLYIDKIKDSQMIKESRIWVYGFDSFAPKAMALLGQLMAAAKQLNLVMTFDDRGRDKDLFELPKIVIQNAERLADSLGIEHERRRIPEDYAVLGRAEAVRHIEKELYAVPAVKCKTAEGSQGLTLVSAANVYNEAESAASFILHLVRDKGLRYRDIKVVCNDMESRGEAAARVFEEYGIQVFSDVKKDILSNAMVQAVTSLLDVVIENYRTESLLTLLKSGIGDFSGEELADLENYSIKYKIKGTMWKKPFRRGKGEYGEEGLAAVNLLRARAVGNLKPLEELLQQETAGGFIKGFYDYLKEQLRIPEKILQLAKSQEAKGLVDLADETRQIWNSLVTILEQMYHIMGQEAFEAESFRDIFTAGLSQVEIGLLPPTEDGLMMGTMQRSRSGKIRALIVMGANEGVIPQEQPTQGLFSPEEREFFASGGKELCKVDAVRFMEEKVAIYKNLSSPYEYLWMSYSAADLEGNQTRPSRIFEKLVRLFPGIEVEKDILNDGESKKLINGSISGMRHLTEALRAVGEGGQLSEDWQHSLSWMEKNRPEEIKNMRDGLAFTNRHEELGRQAADALFRKDTDEALALSPSRIEKFSRCPFSHLISYGLKPEERRIYEAAPREIGDVYHQCLMELTKTLTHEGIDITDSASPWMTVTRKECDQIVEGKIAEIGESYRDGLFNDSNLEVYRGQRVLDICRQVCWTVVEQVRAGVIKSIQPEVSFGRRGQLAPIEINLNDKKVFIEGIIDRVDYLDDDRVKIIDYKTGNEAFDIDEAAAGYRLQLMLYLQAACDNRKKPAGVFYFKIKDPVVDFSYKDVDEEALEKEIRKSFKLDGIMVDDPEVIHGIAGEFEGFSEIVPIKNTKEGVKNTGKEGLLTEEEFEKLQEVVGEKVKELCRDLTDGKIDVHPMKTKERSACTYCSYKGICRFDTAFEGCSYNIIKRSEAKKS